MRLIDADRLLNPGYTDMFDEPMQFAWYSREAIETQPTVEAIPIEWIKAWAKQFCDDKGHYNGDGYDTIWDVLEAWEKIENTPSTCPDCIKK